MQICDYSQILPTREQGKRVHNTTLDAQRGDLDSPAWLPEDWWSYWRPIWQTTKDVYEGLEDYEVRKLYLYQKTGERNNRYLTRLYTSYLDNFFRDAVDSHSGLISQFSVLEDTPDLIRNLLENVDGVGTSFKKFMLEVDRLVLRDDCCFIAVDTPRTDSEKEQRQSRLPSLLAIDIRDVYAPSKSFDGSEYTLDQIAIRRTVHEKNGEFGFSSRDQFWVYRPGTVQIWEKVKDKFVGGEILPFLNAKREPHNHIPLVWYSCSGSPLIEPCTPPFLRLLRLNIMHMNKVSELDTAESMVNSITPFRIWPENIPDPPPDQKFGDDGIWDMEGGGSVGMAEAVGNGTKLTQERIAERERKMKELSYSFLGDRSTPKTATEARLDEGKIKTTLGVVAHNKGSVIAQVFKHAMALGDSAFDYEDPDALFGGIKVSEDAIKAPPSAQDIQVILKGFVEGAYSRPFMLAKLEDMGWNPKDFDLDEELGRVLDLGDDNELVEEDL